MKRTFVLMAAAVLAGSLSFAKESTLIDFTQLSADILPGEDGKPTKNSRTVQDYSVAAGATYTGEQKSLMKTSLSLAEWEVELNSSARSVQALALSHTKAAPVKQSAQVPFAGKDVLGVRIVFPTWANNASARIVPPYEIQGYELYSEADANGVRQAPSEPGKYLYEDGYGLVRNVGTIKSIAVTTMGENYPHKLYVLLRDNDEVERRYCMGNLMFDGWKTLVWNNPNYIAEVRAREIRVYPIYPRGLPYMKFGGFQITRDANDIGSDYVGYFKDVKIIYDMAILTSDRDIDEEDLWGIVTKKEADRKAVEMSRFGNKQVNRYLEEAKRATEETFTTSLNENSDSNAAQSIQ